MKHFDKLLLVLLFVIVLPVLIVNIINYKVQETTETFTAVETLGTPETFTVENTPDSIDKVYVNDVLQVVTTDYTVSGDEVTLLAGETEPDDTILIEYTYTLDVDTGLQALVVLIPLILTGTIILFIAKNKK